MVYSEMPNALAQPTFCRSEAKAKRRLERLGMCYWQRVVPRESVRQVVPLLPRVVPSESVRHELPLLSLVVPRESVRYVLPSLPRVVPRESVRQEFPLLSLVVPNESVRYVAPSLHRVVPKESVLQLTSAVAGMLINRAAEVRSAFKKFMR